MLLLLLLLLLLPRPSPPMRPLPVLEPVHGTGAQPARVRPMRPLSVLEPVHGTGAQSARVRPMRLLQRKLRRRRHERCSGRRWCRGRSSY